MILLGYTADKRPVFGGAFELADTHGLPLDCSLEQADKRRCVISIPHYFASAIKAGWDDQRAFTKIKEAYRDCMIQYDQEYLEEGCRFLFNQAIKQMPECLDPAQIAQVMLDNLERHAVDA